MELHFPIQHVVVVGFHHKKGCQIEFAYPPFEMDIEKTAWKHLPTLAMPDGAHNFTTDTVYFHLPSLHRSGETVFGVACFQQIDAEKIKNKSDEVTRSTIQKSICVLSKYPLYGHIQVKMSLITDAYFREGDFAKVSILEKAYHNLNACLTPDLLTTPEAFVGLSPRDLIFTFRHEVLVLLKLLLLEKRILFRGTSVSSLCSALLTLVSLIPLTLEYGLSESACVKTSKTMSIVPQFSSPECSFEVEDAEKMDAEKSSPDIKSDEKGERTTKIYPDLDLTSEKLKTRKDLINSSLIQGSVSTRSGQAPTLDLTDDAGRIELNELRTPASEAGSFESGFSNSSDQKMSNDIPDFLTAVQLTAADAGLPLKIFTKGYLCHPYLSLHYMDLLSDSGVRGFVVGATNILFKQKRDLVDVIVEMQDGSVEISCPVLKKLVTLTTEDLRFAENVVRNVTQQEANSSNEWIRAQFKYWLMCLMRTSQLEDGNRGRDCFGTQFITAWQNTHHWKVWDEYINSEERDTPGIYLLSPGHPCSGQMGVNDVKLRLAHSMQKTEGGRKLNQAVGKAVASTGKAVGGALTQAKGALSSWWSSVVTNTPTGVEIGSEEANTATQSPPKDGNPLPVPSSLPVAVSTSVNGGAGVQKVVEERQSQSVWFTN